VKGLVRGFSEQRKLSSSPYDVKKEGKDGMCSEEVLWFAFRRYRDMGRPR
jgi:hypothetical protein